MIDVDWNERLCQEKLVRKVLCDGGLTQEEGRKRGWRLKEGRCCFDGAYEPKGRASFVVVWRGKERGAMEKQGLAMDHEQYTKKK